MSLSNHPDVCIYSNTNSGRAVMSHAAAAAAAAEARLPHSAHRGSLGGTAHRTLPLPGRRRAPWPRQHTDKHWAALIPNRFSASSCDSVGLCSSVCYFFLIEARQRLNSSGARPISER